MVSAEKPLLSHITPHHQPKPSATNRYIRHGSPRTRPAASPAVLFLLLDFRRQSSLFPVTMQHRCDSPLDQSAHLDVVVFLVWLLCTSMLHICCRRWGARRARRACGSLRTSIYQGECSRPHLPPLSLSRLFFFFLFSFFFFLFFSSFFF